MTGAIKLCLVVSVPSGNIVMDITLQMGRQFAGDRGLGKDSHSLIAPCIQHLQLSLGHLSNGSAEAVQVYKPGLSGAHAVPWWRGALGRAGRAPQLEQPLNSWGWVTVQLAGRGGEGDAAPLAPHGLSITTLGGLEYGPQRGLETQAESGMREIQWHVSAASESRFVWWPLPHECKLHHDCSTLRSLHQRSEHFGGHQGARPGWVCKAAEGIRTPSFH